jgi:uncharacterized coiled-coil protein SlyX
MTLADRIVARQHDEIVRLRNELAEAICTIASQRDAIQILSDSILAYDGKVDRLQAIVKLVAEADPMDRLAVLKIQVEAVVMYIQDAARHELDTPLSSTEDEECGACLGTGEAHTCPALQGLEDGEP